MLHSVRAFTGVWVRGWTSETKRGRRPSIPIAIITRAALTNTTFAIPNPPATKPSEMRIVTSALSLNIDRKTLKFGE